MAAWRVAAAWHDRVRGADMCPSLNPESGMNAPCRPSLPAHELNQVLDVLCMWSPWYA